MAYYEDFEKIDKICPLLSSKSTQIVLDGNALLYCVGDNCMWFENYCKPKTITILPTLYSNEERKEK